MILDHEIPQGSKLYFGNTAKLKRKVETCAYEVFMQNGFEEIVTPAFSFLQHQHDFSNRQIIRLNSEQNQQLSLRYDSTIDAIRILTKRLSRNVDNKKWFYIQPVFSYPSNEIHQIGAEYLEGDLNKIIQVANEILKKININPLIQFSHSKILEICSMEFKMTPDEFSKQDLNTLMQNQLLKELIMMKTLKDLKNFIPKAPSFIKQELMMLNEYAQACGNQNILIAILQQAPVDYYRDIIFRAFANNHTLLLGGSYEINHTLSCGFGIYTDHLIDYLTKNITI